MRRERSLTLTQLSERSGLSAPFLSQVENNRANPSLASLALIAAALECATIDIIGAADAGRIVEITSAPPLFDDGDRSLNPRGGEVNVVESRRREGGETVPVRHRHDCVLYVARGDVDITVTPPSGPQVHRLDAGASVVCAAGVPYQWSAVSGEAIVLAIRVDDRVVARHE